MLVAVHFLDGEITVAETPSMVYSDNRFVIYPEDNNNTQLWVCIPQIKYITYLDKGEHFPQNIQDPREGQGLQKLVLAILGERLRTFQDEFWLVDDISFRLRLWDAQSRKLYQTMVPVYSTKAVFFVKEWIGSAVRT